MRTQGHGSMEGGAGGTPAHRSPSEVLLQLCLVAKLLEQQGLSLRNPLWSHWAPTEQHWMLFPSFLGTSFNNPLQHPLWSCPKLLLPCPAALRHLRKKGGSGKMDLKATNNEQQCANRVLGMRTILNTVPGRWDGSFQLCCALLWPQADHSLVLCFIFSSVRDSFCLFAWSRSPEAAFAVCWHSLICC